MRKLIGTTVLALLTSANAHAQLLTFEFKAKIESMREGYYAYTDPVTSSTRNGSLISVGDTITGILQYDTATPFVEQVFFGDPQFHGAWSYYEPGSNNQTSMAVTFDKTGYAYQGNILRTDWMLVKDVAAGAGQDLFYIEEWSNNVNAEGGRITLKDSDATALASFAVPGAIDLADYELARYEYRFQGAEGNSVSASAQIFEFKQISPVPEPTTVGMLAIGLLALGARHRRLSGKRFQADV